MRHVCVLGRNRRSVHLAPFADPSVEIWTHAPMRDTVPRVTRYFEIHTREHIREWATFDERGEGYEAFLQQCRIPIYMQEAFADVPASIAYPLDTVLRGYGWWFTSSIAWMLALALYERVDKLSVYGVDLQHQGEYEEELPCAAHFIGRALERGIEVEIAPTSTFCRAARLYGWNTPTPYAHLIPDTRLVGMTGEPTKAFLEDLAQRAAWAQAQYAQQQEQTR